jgi:large subunit ribosomal protein L3
MIQGLIGKKVGMTHLFSTGSRVVPVTVLQVGPCVVTQVRTAKRDGYEAVQIGYGHAKQLNSPKRGHLKPSGAESRVLLEFEADDVADHAVGDALPLTMFQPGDVVDVTSRSKGRGFAGVVKRYRFAGGRKTHGQGDRHRAPGSIGAGTYPGRVLKGKKMPGHMGNRRVTAQNLTVEQVDIERNLLMVRGAVPGARNSTVMVRYADNTKLAERLTAEEWAELMGTPVAEVEPEVEVEETAPVAEAEEVATDEAEAEPEAAVAEEAAAEEAPEAAAEPAEAAAEESGSEEEEGKAE